VKEVAKMVSHRNPNEARLRSLTKALLLPFFTMGEDISVLLLQNKAVVSPIPAELFWNLFVEIADYFSTFQIPSEERKQSIKHDSPVNWGSLKKEELATHWWDSKELIIRHLEGIQRRLDGVLGLCAKAYTDFNDKKKGGIAYYKLWEDGYIFVPIFARDAVSLLSLLFTPGETRPKLKKVYVTVVAARIDLPPVGAEHQKSSQCPTIKN